ncbi:MAG: hypothetical protein CM15mP84_02160 [Cellvibrionales bacterium]|nr:MAG: hypothetical protein CM15mP84_02160 [Cellvibrionales bacterium]
MCPLPQRRCCGIPAKPRGPAPLSNRSKTVLHLIVDVMSRKQHLFLLQHLLKSVVAFAASISLKPRPDDRTSQSAITSGTRNASACRWQSWTPLAGVRVQLVIYVDRMNRRRRLLSREC